MKSDTATEPKPNQVKDNSIGLLILRRFLDEESIDDIAEDNHTNDLLIEECLRQEFFRLIEIIKSKELALRYLERNTRA